MAPGCNHRLEDDLAHHLSRLRQPVAEHPGHGDHLFATQSQVDEDPGVRGGTAVGSQMDRRVGVVRARQTDRALDRLQELQVDSGFLADLPGGHEDAVVSDDATRRQQHRRRLAADLLDAEADLEQPLDELGPLGARLPLEAVEQPRRLDVDVLGHGLNVYRCHCGIQQ